MSRRRKRLRNRSSHLHSQSGQGNEGSDRSEDSQDGDRSEDSQDGDGREDSKEKQSHSVIRMKVRRRKGPKKSRSPKSNIKQEDPLLVAMAYLGGMLLVMGLGVLFFNGLEFFYTAPGEENAPKQEESMRPFGKDRQLFLLSRANIRKT